MKVGQSRVLIDTWWNVNQSFGEEQLKEAFRFNRYMVECEYFKCRYRQ